uniref:Uncharacterized protein n=1 Tax=Oryza brachyantha TaxID=4533 RepID=J3LNX0_ORYBR
MNSAFFWPFGLPGWLAASFCLFGFYVLCARLAAAAARWPSSRAVTIGFGGSSFFFVLMGFAALLYLTGFLSDSSGSSVLTEMEKTTVLNLQRQHWHYLGIQIAALSLFIAPFFNIFVLQADVKRSIDDGEKRFNQLSIQERGKFDEETLVNVNNIKRQKAGSQRSNRFSNNETGAGKHVPRAICVNIEPTIIDEENVTS